MADDKRISELDPADPLSGSDQGEVLQGGANKSFTFTQVKNFISGFFQLLSQKNATGGYVGLSLFKIIFKNASGLFASYLTHNNTASRTYTFQDRNGTIADLTDIEDLLNLLLPNSGTYSSGQILVNLLGGLQVQVIWPIYFIENIQYAAGSDTITLDAADVTNNRFDAIILTASGLDKITGTPSATPEQPTVDSVTQILVTYILVEANQTDLTENDILIYDEGTETTITGNGTFDDQSVAVTPVSGTYVLSHGSFNNTNYLDFAYATDQSIASVTQIKFFLRLISAFSNTTYLKITFFKDGLAVSSTVNIISGSFNFVRTTTGSFQIIIIPIGSFTFTDGSFDKVRITFNGSNANGFYFDFSSLQVGVSSSSPLYNFFKTILDENGLAVVASQPNDTLQIIGSTKTGDKELTVSSGGGGHTIQNESTPLTQRTNLNFKGLIKATDNGGADASEVEMDVTTVITNLLSLSNPSAVVFIRINADNTVTVRTAAELLADLYSGRTSDSSPLDTDEVFGYDTVSGFQLRTTWANVKTFLKTYNDSLYLPLTGGSLSGALNEAKGADIASAGTTDIGAATGNYVNVTGTTTITALGTIQAGTRRIVNFTGVLTLTHNATSLILPTGANITTAAGDVAIFVSLGSGNWKCVTYMKSSGYVSLTGNETIAGVKTFSSSPIVPTPSGTTDAANKAYVDAAIVTESEYAKIQSIWYHLNSF